MRRRESVAWHELPARRRDRLELALAWAAIVAILLLAVIGGVAVVGAVLPGRP